MVRATVPVVMGARMKAIVPPVMPTVIWIVVEPAVRAIVWASVPIVVPAGMPVVHAGLIPSTLIVFMGARSLCKWHEHCRNSQHLSYSRDPQLLRHILGFHRRPP